MDAYLADKVADRLYVERDHEEITDEPTEEYENFIEKIFAEVELHNAALYPLNRYFPGKASKEYHLWLRLAIAGKVSDHWDFKTYSEILGPLASLKLVMIYRIIIAEKGRSFNCGGSYQEQQRRS